jgi:hypothetical protein
MAKNQIGEEKTIIIFLSSQVGPVPYDYVLNYAQILKSGDGPAP